MTQSSDVRTGRALGADIDRLVRGEPPAVAANREYQALVETAARLVTEEARPLRQPRPGYQAQLEARLLAQLPAARRSWWRRFTPRLAPPRPALSRGLAGGVAVLLLVVVVTGTAVAASSRIRVYRPEQPSADPPQLVPFLPPPGTVEYRPADPATTARTSGRALAYLSQPPAGLADVVEVSLLPTAPVLAPDTIALHIHALVRYRGGGHTVLVVLDEPSAALARQRSIVLGDRTIRLADGREAWASTRPNWPQSNVVAWVVDGYIVIVASDLPPETVVALAEQVVVMPAAEEAPNGATPSALPPAMSSPAGAQTGRADLTVSGEVRQGGRGDRPQLIYRLSLGNRGDGPAEDVRVAVEVPPALAPRALDAAAPTAFGRQGPGQLSGLGGTITFDVAGLDAVVVREALAAGITIRVTWLEGGGHQERAFIIR